MSVCDICKNDFKNKHGLNIHKSKVHADRRATPSTPASGGARPKTAPSAIRNRVQHGGRSGAGNGDVRASPENPLTKKSSSATKKSEDKTAKEHVRPSTAGRTSKVSRDAGGAGAGSLPPSHGTSRSTPEKKKPPSTTKLEKISEDKTGKGRGRPSTAGRGDRVVERPLRSAPHSVSRDEGRNGGGNWDLPPSHAKTQSTHSSPPESQEGLARSCHAKDITKYMTMLEAGIKRPKSDTDLRVDSVNNFLESLLKTMERTSDIPLDVLKSGSYYDRTKIDYDDEFDFMFYPDAKMEADFTGCPPGFCKIKKGRTTNKSLDSLCNGNGYLVPDRFKEKMFSIFEQCIKSPDFREGRRTERKKRLEGSPAFTVLYDLRVTNKTPIDIDFVPAIRVEGWPKTAREIHPQWLEDSNIKHAMKCFHVVTKTFPGHHRDGDLLWRVSFSHAEKELILHANLGDKKGCRKLIFKLLKKVKEDMKDQNPSKMDKFCSYHLKMFMLRFFDKHDCFTMDRKETLFIQSIKELTKCVTKGEIENYFIPNDNVLRFVTKEEKDFIAEKLRNLQEEFKL